MLSGSVCSVVVFEDEHCFVVNTGDGNTGVQKVAAGNLKYNVLSAGRSDHGQVFQVISNTMFCLQDDLIMGRYFR